MISNETKAAMNQVWHSIAPDVYDSVTCNEECIELVLDANRLEFHGFPEAQKEVSFIMDLLGVSRAYVEIAKEVQLY